ncbi:hypothetical protein MMC13_006431 [Lambiella insularis]|nr:hypothetical protein [Lambiella insularis]
MSFPRPRLILHGGAGPITRSNLPPSVWYAYRASLLAILQHTSHLLSSGASALDAATSAVALFEENPLFNCGRGAVFTRAGTIELEASVMVSRGYRKRGVGVALLKRVRNPILLAKEMLIMGEEEGGEGLGHSFLSGEPVEELARGWGLEMCKEGWHWTRRRWEEHRRGLEGEGEGEGEYLPQGTVGCVCLDRYGTLCVATSTGGLTNKLPGRIGDTPTLGAGFWAEEWEVPARCMVPQPYSLPWTGALLPSILRDALGVCLPTFHGYRPLPASAPTSESEKQPHPAIRAVAMSGTGNGDSFLRLDAVRTAAAIAHFAPGRSLASAVRQVAGPGGELEGSAGERWGRTGEGEGGVIGIEVVEGRGEVVFDFNCGGMFRAWVDEGGRERVMVFREEY